MKQTKFFFMYSHISPKSHIKDIVNLRKKGEIKFNIPYGQFRDICAFGKLYVAAHMILKDNSYSWSLEAIRGATL